jgi:hypothetical protein
MQLSGVTDRRDSHLFNAMVFMADSERAADLARENGLGRGGLPLNFTDRFTNRRVASKVANHHTLTTFQERLNQKKLLADVSKLYLRTRQFYLRGTSFTGTHPPGTDRDELAGFEGRSSINMEFA